MNVIVTGSLGYDYIMNFPGRFADRIMPDKIHKISLGFLADKLNKQFGGTAVNIAYTLKLLGAEPYIAAPAGNDFAELESFLRKHQIPTDFIPRYKNEPCGCYFVVTDRDDNQIGSYYMGALKYAKDLSVSKLFKGPCEIFVVLSPTEPAAMIRYVKECRENKFPYLYDPAFQIGNFSADELRMAIEGAEIIIGNDYEIALIENKLEISHEELLAIGPKVVITTLGAKGSIIETRKEAIHVKSAKPKNVSDPTGAGDAYRAGFLAGYLRFLSRPGLDGSQRPGLVRTDDLLVCGQMGSVAAVYTVEKYGTVTHYFTKAEFLKRYKENFGTSLTL